MSGAWPSSATFRATSRRARHCEILFPKQIAVDRSGFCPIAPPSKPGCNQSLSRIELKPLQRTFVAPFLEQPGERDGAVAVEAVARRQSRGLAFVVVVAGRALLLEFLAHDGGGDD